MLNAITLSSGERNFEDFYPTPHGLAYEIAKDFIIPASLFGGSILDVGAGTGIWGQALYKAFVDLRGHNHSFKVTGIDIYHSEKPQWYTDWHVTDFLEFNTGYKYDYVIGNFPFKNGLPEKFIRHILKHNMADKMVLLLPLNMLTGQRRHFGTKSNPKALWSLWKPFEIVPLGLRPSFTGDGKTYPGQEFAVYRWSSSYCPSQPSLRMGWSYEMYPDWGETI